MGGRRIFTLESSRIGETISEPSIANFLYILSRSLSGFAWIGGVETSGANWGWVGGGADLDYCDWWISVAHYYWVTSQ